MKRISLFLIGSLFISSCQTNSSVDQIMSQTYVHKYGFETSEKDWEAREQDGQVVSVLKNGVKVTRSYENGILHGPTTYTFPNSPIIEKSLVYDQGTLLKEQLNDSTGIPIQEEVYEFDHRKCVILWSDKGVPLSVEEYDGEVLLEAKYYTPDHELEASIVNGCGERVRRDRAGVLISRDEIRDGILAYRTNYHPNGNIHTISHYQDYQLHGLQSKFTAAGRPLMESNWERGVLNGPKVIYRNGFKAVVIPYVQGEKHGTELHYDDLGTLISEVEWNHDQKHGYTKLYSEESVDTEWFFRGQSVNAEKFKILDNREKTISGFRDQEIR